MSASRWQRPKARPPKGRLSSDGRVVVLHDASLKVPTPLPAPLLQAEVDLWQRPPAGVCFPLHPVAITVLYDRAWAALEGTGVLDGLAEDDRSTLASKCWRIASLLFKPGMSIRAAMERVLEGRALHPNLTGVSTANDRLRLLQLAHLASWAVFRAATSWSEDAK
ncbi:hypothetical protein JDY09_00650 [Thermoleophilum album]|jgi:hypothetical protein|uniref:hypothetical protein n=1 Tax=Thermoleophilum album TaxID=29539 RepID=UPI00237C753E|nr:hypothetical protein [Thermoleophilum album]WDT93806.1 hypothetical protein JDY09_00650 [Thermoleophilum album]